MEHAQAIIESAAEKYLLHELTPAQAEEFEAHLFDCPECAAELKVTSEFMDRVRQELATMQRESAKGSLKPSRPAVAPSRQSWWASLFSPQVAAPAMAVLLGVILYQNLAVIPHLGGGPVMAVPQVTHPLSLIGANSRGGGDPVLTTRRGDSVLLSFDIPTATSYAGYSSELRSPSGKVLWQLPITATEAQDTVTITVPGIAWESGQYTLVVRGVPEASGSAASEIARYPFRAQMQDR